MPLYDYRCSCGFTGEFVHGMNDKLVLECPECGLVLRRVFSVPNLMSVSSVVKRLAVDRLRQESDMRQDLRENHGVERFTPFARGIGVSEVYNDVKAAGTYVAERMQAEKEASDAKRKAKQKEWMRKAIKRTPARSRERDVRKAAEKAASRAISVSA